MCARRDGAGRPGSSEMTRIILAILGGLSEEGDMVNAHAVARRFSNSEDFAERLMESIKVLPAGEEFFLPLYFKDGDPDMALIEDGVRGRRLRLTRDETIALVAALDRVGISEGNSLRKRISASMVAAGVSEDEAERCDAPSGDGDTTPLEACVRALCAGRRVGLLYQGRLDAEPRWRTVDPTGLHQAEGMWYVDAFDVDRQGMRAFRADRIHDVEERGTATRHEQAASAQARLVDVCFRDPSVLTTLWWPGLEVVSQEGDRVTARIPYYGGDWLARRLAACGGTATTDDPELARRVGEVAARLLANVGETSED